MGSFKILSTNHTSFTVSDLDWALSFFRDILGFEVTSKAPRDTRAIQHVTRGIYDNMKTAVDAIFAGKERRFNLRFAQMCSHYLVEPVTTKLRGTRPHGRAKTVGS